MIERKSLLTSFLGEVGIKISGNGGADFPRTYLVISHAWCPKYAHLGMLFVAEQEIRRHPRVFSVRKEGGGKITCIANAVGPSHRWSMRQGGTGASGGQIAISIGDFAMHCEANLWQIASGGYEGS